MNHVAIIGNMTREAEHSQTSSGRSVCKLGIAVNERWKNREGNQQEIVTYINVTVWGAQADTCAKHLGKGSKVAVEGKLRLNEWETKDGQKRKDMYVQADRVEFLTHSKSDERAAGQGDYDEDSNLPF